MKPKYLVRPSDFYIFELDESNGCYRTYVKMDIVSSKGTRMNALTHFTFENLTNNYEFFSIEECDLSQYEIKHKKYKEYEEYLRVEGIKQSIK